MADCPLDKRHGGVGGGPLTILGRLLNWAKLSDELKEAEDAMKRPESHSWNWLYCLEKELEQIHGVYSGRAEGMKKNEPSRQLFDQIDRLLSLVRERQRDDELLKTVTVHDLDIELE
jgi:hypothetical protein